MKKNIEVKNKSLNVPSSCRSESSLTITCEMDLLWTDKPK